ncbi:MAG: hypothetical protein JWO25_482 [Alphaproteobacteria bacterium]|nr:hypothetical protein [Alphaproteobacteria bacterium]
MRVFLDFEASSLGKRGFPIEIAWMFETGEGESHLIRPALGWTDWDQGAEAIHHILRSTLESEGEPHDRVARRMIEALDGHDLYASAPSWDGKWLSALLRAASLPRHRLRLRASQIARRESVTEILAPLLEGEALAKRVEAVLARAQAEARAAPVSHRALDDAEQERQRWLAACRMAEAERAGIRGGDS